MASAGTPYRLVPAHFYPWDTANVQEEHATKKEMKKLQANRKRFVVMIILLTRKVVLIKL